MSKVVVDQDLCIGCGSCEQACPSVFKLGEDGKSHVISQENPDGCDLHEVALDCPVQAITVTEEA